MSKSQELIAKRHPVSAGDILGMVAGLSAAAMHIYTIDPTGKLSQMFATEAIPPLRQIILPIAEEANQLAAANDAEADGFLEVVTAAILLLDKPLSRAALSRQFLELRKTVMQQRPELAAELSAFQFRDLRAKAATDIYLAADTRSASDQLGHASEQMTKIYIRRGKILKPLK